jgi:outer membrane immunogenic protein
MHKELISAAVAALGITCLHGASAADLPVKALPPPYTLSWAGFYVGGNAGFASGNTTTTDILATNNLPWVQNGAQWGTKLSGFAGGGQVGYNWQFGNLVVGVESDVGYLGATGSGPYPLLPTTTADTHGGLFSTARGRLGVAVDHVLLYGTGGWFGADLDTTINQSTGGTVIHTSSPGFRSGWTAGGGLEWAFSPRWSLKGEYLHYDVGTEKVGGAIFNNTVTQFFNVKNTGEIVRAGVNYHF